MPAEQKSFVYDGPPERLDKYLTHKLAPRSRTQIQNLIEEGHVDVNGAAGVSRLKLAAGDRVTVTLPEFSSLPAAAADSIPVLYEDADVIVVNKPAGIPVHPAGPHQKDTLIQRLWPKLAPAWESERRKSATREAAARPGVVHRLDKGTSGVMVIARNLPAGKNLSEQFAARAVKKIYRALARGIPAHDHINIKSSVGRSRQSPYKMSTAVPGRESETDVRVLKTFRHPDWPSCYLEVHPLTGRTHQIRVQLAALGHALWGDELYEGHAKPKKPFPAERPLLHALKLTFAHPSHPKKILSFEAPVPADFQAALDILSA